MLYSIFPFLYILIDFTLIMLFITIVMRLAYKVVRVRGESMHPTLVEGDKLIVLYWWPKRFLHSGQIVVSKPRQKIIVGQQFYHIKRIIATAGAEVSISLSDIQTAPYRPVQFYDEHGLRIWPIPPRHVFVRGDNRMNSLDSATFGPLPFEKIDGVVLMKLPRTFLLFSRGRK